MRSCTKEYIPFIKTRFFLAENKKSPKSTCALKVLFFAKIKMQQKAEKLGKEKGGAKRRPEEGCVYAL